MSGNADVEIQLLKYFYDAAEYQGFPASFVSLPQMSIKILPLSEKTIAQLLSPSAYLQREGQGRSFNSHFILFPGIPGTFPS